MKLGVVADEISRDFRKAVQVGKSLGLERYEIRFLQSGRAPMCEESELREVEKIAAGEGVKITALSPGLFKWSQTEEHFKLAMSEVFPRAVELAQRWNLKNLITFGFHKPGTTEEEFYRAGDTPEQILEWFTISSEAAGKAGLELIIEPEPVCWMDTGTRIVDLIKATDAKNIGINYDPGNVAWLLQKDPFDEFEISAPFIRNVHVKDLCSINNGKAIWAVPGEGIIDFQKHFQALKKIGYDDNMSLEPHLDNSAEATAKCKSAVERVWATAID